MRAIPNAKPGHRPAGDRRKDLAAIHAAAAALGMDTADKAPGSEYRTLLLQHGGKLSSAELDAAGRARVLARLRALQGLHPSPKPPHGWQADKIERLWRQLAQDGALHDSSASALGQFVQRITGLSAPRFLPAGQANKVIEALKSWRARHARAQAKAAAEAAAQPPQE